jgi:hypothetical protein
MTMVICLRDPTIFQNYFSQLLNVHSVRQTEIHSTEPLILGPSRLEVGIAIAKLKKYKSRSLFTASAKLYKIFSLLYNHINIYQPKQIIEFFSFAMFVIRCS